MILIDDQISPNREATPEDELGRWRSKKADSDKELDPQICTLSPISPSMDYEDSSPNVVLQSRQLKKENGVPSPFRRRGQTANAIGKPSLKAVKSVETSFNDDASTNHLQPSLARKDET